MNIYVKYLKPLLFTFISLLILTFVFTFFNYINFINGTLFNIIKILIPFISLFIGSFLIGKHEKELERISNTAKTLPKARKQVQA